jgi:hypothetical protein
VRVPESLRSKRSRFDLCSYAEIELAISPSRGASGICRCHALWALTTNNEARPQDPLTNRVSTLPAWLKPSAAVDLTQLVASIRPAVRTELAQRTDDLTVRRWARYHGWYVAMDTEGFLVLSASPSLVRRVLAIDQSPGNHTSMLGRALGYPPCCYRAANRVGEHALDAWSISVSAMGFVGRFKLIDPRGYLRGRSFISHIPCGPWCLLSLRMAEGVKKWQRHRQRVQVGRRFQRLPLLLAV